MMILGTEILKVFKLQNHRFFKLSHHAGVGSGTPIYVTPNEYIVSASVEESCELLSQFFDSLGPGIYILNTTDRLKTDTEINWNSGFTTIKFQKKDMAAGNHATHHHQIGAAHGTGKYTEQDLKDRVAETEQRMKEKFDLQRQIDVLNAKMNEAPDYTKDIIGAFKEIAPALFQKQPVHHHAAVTGMQGFQEKESKTQFSEEELTAIQNRISVSLQNLEAICGGPGELADKLERLCEKLKENPDLINIL